VRASLVLLVLVASTVVHADSDADAARKHFDAGTAAFNLGEFTHAADEYREAYRFKHDPVFLYNIAQAYRLANDHQNALFFYRSYLRNMPGARNQAEVEDRVRKLEETLAAQRKVQQPPNQPLPPGNERAPSASPPPGAVGTTPPTTTTAPPPAATTAPETTPSATPAAVVTTEAPPPEKRTPVYKKWWLWTAVGVVVVGVGVGLGVGLASSGSSAPSSHFGTVGTF
jgi:hypothetical protein